MIKPSTDAAQGNAEIVRVGQTYNDRDGSSPNDRATAASPQDMTISTTKPS